MDTNRSAAIKAQLKRDQDARRHALLYPKRDQSGKLRPAHWRGDDLRH